MKTSLRDYWEVINYNYEQIRFAEIKSSVIISVFSLVFTFAYTIDILDEIERLMSANQQIVSQNYMFSMFNPSEPSIT